MWDRAPQNPRIDSTRLRWTLEEWQPGDQERAAAENIAVAGRSDPAVQRPFTFSDCGARSYRQSKHRKFHGYRPKSGADRGECVWRGRFQEIHHRDDGNG